MKVQNARNLARQVNTFSENFFVTFHKRLTPAR